MIHEECGVFGVYDLDHAPLKTFLGLHSLQHRGQEGSGLAYWEHDGIDVIKGSGLTVDVFDEKLLKTIESDKAIGHVRYGTHGGKESENIQPFAADGLLGPIAVVHNGQIVNEALLRQELENEGCIFAGTSDSETILHLIMKESGSLKERIMKTARKLDGAFCFLVLCQKCLYAVRDRYGFHPLCLAKTKNGWMISSESCAFEAIGIRDYEDILPGECVEFSRHLMKREFYTDQIDRHVCAMEYIYFARPDSVMDGANVHLWRKESGTRLAAADLEDGFAADLVIGVPDSSLSAAIGYSQASGIPMESGLIKNRYVARTFIQPTQQMRDQAVKMKLSALRDVVAGKSVVMIDDSIVRGTTSRRIVRLLKDAGAAQVHVRISSPPMISPCFYGVDTTTRDQLIASHMSVEDICEYLQADSLRFLSLQDLEALHPSLCTACFSGHYPSALYTFQSEIENDPEF